MVNHARGSRFFQFKILERRNAVCPAASPPIASRIRLVGSGTAEGPARTGELFRESPPKPLLDRPSVKLAEPIPVSNVALDADEPAENRPLDCAEDCASGLPLESEAAIVTKPGLPALPPITSAF